MGSIDSNARVLATLAIAGLLLAGCSGGSSDSSSTGAAAAPAQGAVTQAQAPGPDRLVLARIAGAAVVRTGEVLVQVDDVPRAADEAARLARGAGGQVATDERSSDGDAPGSAHAVLVLRLPPARFDAVLERVAGLGEERSRNLGSEDVTDQVIDLQTRLTTQRASVARVQALLDRAATVGEVVKVEGELTKRTADLESMQARLAAVEDRVQQGTLTVRLDATGAPLASQSVGFLDGVLGGSAALAAFARVTAVVIGALLPFLPIALAAAAALAWRARRRRVAVPAR